MRRPSLLAALAATLGAMALAGGCAAPAPGRPAANASSSAGAATQDPAPPPDPASPFAFAEDAAAGTLTLTEAGRPVLTYRHGDQLAAGVAADRTRSSYVHPILGLDGEVLTEDFPKDHPHHRGLSLMWPRMQVRGQRVELWHIKGIRSLFREWLERSATPEHALLRVGNDWRLTDGTVVATETLTLRVHRATAQARVIDVEYHIQAREPVVVQGQVGKGYGGLNLRFAPREDTVITTDRGPQPKDGDRVHHAWADLSARFGGREQVSGIAILARDDHPAFPPPWTLRPYGDLNVAWPGLQPFTIEPEQPLTLGYRLWVHRGDAAQAGVAAAAAAYARSTGAAGGGGERR